MGDSSFFSIPSRLVGEGEQLVVHRFPGGSLGLASITDVRRLEPKTPKGSFWQRIRRGFQDADGGSNPVPPVCMPSTPYPEGHSGGDSTEIRRGRRGRYLFVKISTEVSGYTDELRFNNGVQIRLQELRAGQLVEVLSLAGTHPDLYEQELQMQ